MSEAEGLSRHFAQVIRSFFHHAEEVELLMDRRFWITLSIITAVGPLSYLRKLDSLKYTSMIALFAVAYLVIIVLYHYISPNFPPPPPESIEYFHFSTKIFSQLPVFIFAFTCHQNVSVCVCFGHLCLFACADSPPPLATLDLFRA